MRWAIIVLGVLALVWIGQRLWELYRIRRRETVEDALKILWDCFERQMDCSPEVLAGRLRLSPRATLRLLQTMNERGLVFFEGGRVRLTPTGKALGLHVLRAHRLWERYLSDNAQVPLVEVHRLADKQEHHLTSQDVDRLEASLGHPRRDPHGDPIPRGGEVLPEVIGIPLTDWPEGQPARIVHIEDEPEDIFAQALADGLLPGTDVIVQEKSPQGVRLTVDGNDIWLASVVALHIYVMPRPVEEEKVEAAMTLADLAPGQKARVIGISHEVRGLLRRRLLDLGFTRGAVVEAVLRSAFGGGDPIAFRVRGTVIALRREQAQRIFVEPVTYKEDVIHEHKDRTESNVTVNA